MTSNEPISIRERILKSSVRRSLDVVGDRWTLLIVLGAFYGFSRFDEWLQRYNMSSSVLSDRLKRLQRNGLLVKELIEGSRRHRYVFTDAGRGLLPWALAIWHWENLWLYQHNGHPVTLVHTKCGEVMTPEFRCSHCDNSFSWTDVQTRDGPGLQTAEISQVRSSRRSIVTTDKGDGHQNYGRILDILGDRWSYLIISASLYKVRRFDDFLTELNIAPGVLSDRLKRLVDAGMLARSLYQERPPLREYILSEKTMDFAMVPLMLGLWGDRQLPIPEGPAIIRVHTHCGNLLDLKLTCSCCGGELKQEDVRFRDNEGANANED